MLTGGLGLGDLARNTTLRQSNGTLQKNLARTMQEATTGIAADRSARLAGDHRLDARLNGSLTLLGSYSIANAEAGILAGAMQTALSTVQDELQASTSAALLASGTGNAAGISATATDIRERLATVISALNVQAGGRTAFAGTATGGPATIGTDALLDALTTAVAGETTATGVAAKVAAWFEDSGAFYTGATTSLAALQIAPGQSVQLNLTAADPAIGQVLQGMALAAIADRVLPPGEQSASLLQRAGEIMANAASNLTIVAADVGIVEARISEAAVRNTAEETSVKLSLSTLLSVDPYEAATELEATEKQLETLYAITARLSALSLTDYLR